MYANSMGYYYHAGYPIANWGECIPLFLGTFVLLEWPHTRDRRHTACDMRGVPLIVGFKMHESPVPANQVWDKYETSMASMTSMDKFAVEYERPANRQLVTVLDWLHLYRFSVLISYG